MPKKKLIPIPAHKNSKKKKISENLNKGFEEFSNSFYFFLLVAFYEYTYRSATFREIFVSMV